MRVRHVTVFAPFLLVIAPALRAEYFVLRSGQRLDVTGYQLLGGTYRLQLRGGTVEVPAEQVVAIEPEEIFTPAPSVEVSKEPFGDLITAAAKRYSVDADLITSVIAAESNQFRSQSHFAARRARADAAFAGHRRKLGREKYFRSPGKYRRRHALPA